MDSSLQLRVLEVLEGAENYNRWIAALTLPYLGDDPVEVGSGIGVSAALWLGSGLPRITVTDTDESSLERLRSRFAGDTRVHVERLDLSEIGRSEPQRGGGTERAGAHRRRRCGVATRRRPCSAGRSSRHVRPGLPLRGRALRPAHRAPPALHPRDCTKRDGRGWVGARERALCECPGAACLVHRSSVAPADALGRAAATSLGRCGDPGDLAGSSLFGARRSVNPCSWSGARRHDESHDLDAGVRRAGDRARGDRRRPRRRVARGRARADRHRRRLDRRYARAPRRRESADQRPGASTTSATQARERQFVPG